MSYSKLDQEVTLIPSKTVRYIRFKTDQKTNGGAIGEVRRELLGEDLKMPDGVARTIFRALSEAMTNVQHHAYETKQFQTLKSSKQLKNRWWMFARLHIPRNLFSLAFYDAGVGIPKTLPRKHHIEKVRSVLSLLPGIKPDDGQMIEAAMTIGRSGTNLGHRGKGLLDLAKLIDRVEAGRMTIYSRQGVYSYTPTDKSTKNHSGFVEGTLIEWDLPLNKALDVLQEKFNENVDFEDNNS